MPYDRWGVVGIAGRLDLKMAKALDFEAARYPGYSHRRTSGFRPGLSKDGNEDITYKKCKTFIFERKAHYMQKVKEKERESMKRLKKRKRKGEHKKAKRPPKKKRT